MPQRTNDFQTLVRLVQESLASQGAKITESAMIKAHGIGELREIDVLIEQPAGPYTIKIAIEARGQKRKLDAQGIEAFIGKYRGAGSVQVNKIVIVCPNGFSRQAEMKAEANDIQLLTLSSITKEEIEKLSPSLKGGTVELSVGPHIVQIRLLAAGKVIPNEAWKQGSRVVCKCHGNSHGCPTHYAGHVMKSHLFKNLEFVTKFNQEILIRRNSCAKVQVPMDRFVLRTNNNSYPLDAMTFHIHTARTQSSLECEVVKMSGMGFPARTFQHAHAIIGGHRIDVVVPHGGAPGKPAMKVTPLRLRQ